MVLMVKKIPRVLPVRALRVALVVVFSGLFPPGQTASPQAGAAPDDDLQVRTAAEVSISTDQQMDFGQLADKDGSVTLGLTDSISSDPSFIHYGGSPYSGIYTLTGDPSTAVDITIATSPSNGFTLASFVSSAGGLPLIGTLLSPAGELVLTVGATLTVDSSTAVIGSGQAVSFTITSTYN
jgi:Domain of unknown function (DUF4402)